MKYKLATTCFVIGSVLAPVAAYAADGDTDRSKPTTFVKDSVITTKIKAEYARDKQVSFRNIHVDTDDKNVVTLSGNAKSKAEMNKAVAIAKKTEGVVTVKNHIKVQAKKKAS